MNSKPRPVIYMKYDKSVLPMRFCEKVGFFSGTDKATAEGGTSLGGSGGMLPRKIFENCKANRAILQHLGKNSLFFSLLKIDMFKVNLGIKELLYIFFPYVLLIYIARHFIQEMQLCSVKLSAASLLSDVGLRDQQLRQLLL